ncbi:MAG: hypothetical protein ACRDTT_07825, partial [Pseudonocardiaceae bacterium]
MNVSISEGCPGMSSDVRRAVKRGLARTGRARRAQGVSLLIYHRIGGGTRDERDLATEDFVRQMDALAQHEVVSLDTALDGLAGGDRTH